MNINILHIVDHRISFIIQNERDTNSIQDNTSFKYLHNLHLYFFEHLRRNYLI